jgi:hypothetical protein
MNSQQIRDVIAWIKTHPQHLHDELVGWGPSYLFATFMRDPTLIRDYEEPNNDEMLGPYVPNSCTYVFKAGSRKSARCNTQTIPGKTHCRFHDHTIFSDELHNHINQWKQGIDQACVGL